VQSAKGDYESIKRIDSVSVDAVQLSYSAEFPGVDGQVNRTRTRRLVRRVDLDSARVYHQGFKNSDDLEYPGSTALGVRQALVRQYGVSAARLTTAGFGATRPKGSNTTLAGRARNRRVELTRL
jgi:hypothetical protein